MATEAQRRANREQDKARRQDKVRLTAEAIDLLDNQRGEVPRATYITQILKERAKASRRRA